MVTVSPVDLRNKRRALRLTQAELGRRLGLSGAHVYRLEAGLRSVSFPVALRCAELFGSLQVTYRGRGFTLTAR
ncbi:MAG: helix-turn-helix transcriptional regulator [Acetobacteraceae bacterium]|nr:helix-turn-helix transcriptional regulator [Acetobacteraceae bacterium]